jgi:hypothetical protein
MIGYWTNFAVGGNPNETGRSPAAVSDMPFWPNYNAPAAILLSLMDRPQVTTAFQSAHQCVLWGQVNPNGRY